MQPSTTIRWGGVARKLFWKRSPDDGEDIGAFRAQSLTSLSGKILRLDPETGLGIPSNPILFRSGSSTVSKLWAYGFREPVGLTSLSTEHEDDHPGHFIVGDRGWNVLEELNHIKMAEETTDGHAMMVARRLSRTWQTRLQMYFVLRRLERMASSMVASSKPFLFKSTWFKCNSAGRYYEIYWRYLSVLFQGAHFLCRCSAWFGWLR